MGILLHGHFVIHPTFGPVKGGISPLTEETNGHLNSLLYLYIYEK